MGILISKLWKKLTKEEELKKVVEKMRDIQEFKRSTQLKQKRMVANLILYGCALYILASVAIGIWFLPDSVIVRACLLIPLILVPFIIFWLKRLLSWFFENKMVRANEQYETLTLEKQKIITSIMETETFNKAKSILALYAPERLDKKEFTGETELRRRAVGAKATSPAGGTVAVVQPPAEPQTPLNSLRAVSSTPGSSVMSAARSGIMLKAQLPLPQPVFPKDRSFGDKLVEYIVGDGPSYRYALVCRQCREHNGMALKEEFPYMSFYCCYCRAYNPSKVSRPSAPRLPEEENAQAITNEKELEPTNQPKSESVDEKDKQVDADSKPAPAEPDAEPAPAEKVVAQNSSDEKAEDLKAN